MWCERSNTTSARSAIPKSRWGTPEPSIRSLRASCWSASARRPNPIDRTYPTEHITREAVVGALQSLCGERLQTPPLYSAKKVEGVRAYDIARAGESVELRQALVNIYEIELLSYDMPRVRIRVRCSKGTYIRSLAREVGEALGSGAHLTALRRTRSGGFTLRQAHELDDFLKKLAESETK